jgi:peptidoglycan/xylan/chitin deacetylase (PgdA/CDA1 family)
MRFVIPALCSFSLLVSCKQPNSTSEEQALAFEDSLTSGSQIGLQAMEVALTLDDGPVPESLPLAKKLRDLEIPVSYFMIGVNIQRYPQVTKEIAELRFNTGPMAGKHATIIANHSWDHKRKNSEIACIACDGTEYANMEIAKTDALIRGYVTQANKPFFFRAPGGNFFRRDVAEEVKSLTEINKDLSKYIGPFFWDVSGDVEGVCLKETAEKCGGYYMEQIRRKGRSHGIIVLAHDIHEKTRTMLLGDGKYPGIIAQMKREGFKFVHLDKYPAALSKFGNVPRNEFGEVTFKTNRVAEKTYNFEVKVKGASRIEVFIDRLQQPLFSGTGSTLQGKRVITTGGQRIFMVKGFDSTNKQIAQGSRSVDLPF